MKPSRLLALSSFVLALLLVAPTQAMSAPGPSKPAAVVITFSTPDGVPGLTELLTTRGAVGGVTTKAVAGITATTSVTVPAGVYKVEPRPVMAGGVRYVGVPSSNTVKAKAGTTANVTVTYTKSKGVQDLTVTNLTPTSVSLSWSVPAGGQVQIRRTEGKAAASSPSQGVALHPSGSTLTDSGLKPGVQYNYSFWARPGDSAFGVTQANGPVVFTIGTPDPSDATKPTYLATPGTKFMTAADTAALTPVGDGLQVALASGVHAPAPGAAMILPISSVLPGGYLGVVSSVSADGRTVLLRAGGLGDAFEFYLLDVPDLSALPVQTAPVAPAAAASTAPTASRVKQAKDKASRTHTAAAAAAAATLAKSASADAGVSAKSSGVAAPVGTSNPLSQTPKPECGWGGGAELVDFKPDFKVAGHAITNLTKKKLAWVNVPVGFTWDIQSAVTVSGAAKFDVTASYECQVKTNPILKTFTATPVPMSVYLKPTVEVGVGGLLKVSNVGLALTLGFQTDGHVGFDGGNDIHGKLISTAAPLSPVLEAGGATVTGKIAATLLIGPGAGSEKVGVIVGIGGEFSPLDLKVSITLTNAGTGCFAFDAAYKVGLVLSARAWLGSVKFEGTYPIPNLSQQFPYPGSPFRYPVGCDKPASPPDSIIGDGVTKTGDSVSGSPDQMGYVDGFVPGAKTWVLSTGKISDALGAPSFFASSNMGQPGDSQLSALSGHPTYDAASYTVTVVPSGTILKVKYAFASEEYPEFVGSSYNDVMAVFVNGINCATVPGGSDPVSINTVNADTNAAYFVDNLTGASGYGTSYDGLTKPLTCSVPVTPGVPVTVKIAVADASDAIYDSGVALLDQGIWSE